MVKVSSGFRVLHPGFVFLSSMFKVILVLAVCLSVAQAAPGDLDPSFGTGGKVATDMPVASDYDGDGKADLAGFR